MHPISVKLTKGLFAKIDEIDSVRILDHKWHICNGYARRCIKGSKPRKYILMHHEILGVEPSMKLVVDHINRDRLDNRRSNLRVVSRSINYQNSDRADVVGVDWYPYNQSSPWRAKFGKKHLGYFTTFEEARTARLEAESMVE